MTPDITDGGRADLLAAFWSYERAQTAGDLAALDGWCDDAPDTLCAEGTSVLCGHAAIAGHRRTRPGGAVPARTVERLHLAALGEAAAVLTAEVLRRDGGRGLETQVWQQAGDGWRVRATHVSAAPPPAPVSGPDPAVWRVTGRGGPLVPPTAPGPLSGVRLAVKDLFAVAGHPIGAGNPTWLAEAEPQPHHAKAVRLLLSVGAEVTGIAHTDELAFSLSGTNIHYGTPVNPAAPGHVTGGSSSGVAAAVARGWADLGLGSDTAGSIRVPASYCGLYGWRPSHGAVPTAGLLPLAPSFDTPGLLAREPGLLRRAACVLLMRASHNGTHPGRPIERLTTSPALTALASPAVQRSFAAACRALSLRTGLPLTATDLRLPEGWFAAFRTQQAAEAWRQHGAWIDGHPGALAPEIAARFATGRDGNARAGVNTRDRPRLALPPGTALLLPATSSPAPRADVPLTELETLRAATLRLTYLASIAGLPAVVAPLLRAHDLPVGLCALAAPGADVALLDLLCTP